MKGMEPRTVSYIMITSPEVHLWSCPNVMSLLNQLYQYFHEAAGKATRALERKKCSSFAA